MLTDYIPTMVRAIRRGARRPGQCGVPPMLAGRVLAQRLGQLETALAADVVRLAGGAFRVEGWFDADFDEGRPAAPRTDEDRWAAEQISHEHAQRAAWRKYGRR